jgi:hypothetical protein
MVASDGMRWLCWVLLGAKVVIQTLSNVLESNLRDPSVDSEAFRLDVQAQDQWAHRRPTLRGHQNAQKEGVGALLATRKARRQCNVIGHSYVRSLHGQPWRQRRRIEDYVG